MRKNLNKVILFSTMLGVLFSCKNGESLNEYIEIGYGPIGSQNAYQIRPFNLALTIKKEQNLSDIALVIYPAANNDSLTDWHDYYDNLGYGYFAFKYQISVPSFCDSYVVIDEIFVKFDGFPNENKYSVYYELVDETKEEKFKSYTPHFNSLGVDCMLDFSKYAKYENEKMGLTISIAYCDDNGCELNNEFYYCFGSYSRCLFFYVKEEKITFEDAHSRGN